MSNDRVIESFNLIKMDPELIFAAETILNYIKQNHGTLLKHKGNLDGLSKEVLAIEIKAFKLLEAHQLLRDEGRIYKVTEKGWILRRLRI